MDEQELMQLLSQLSPEQIAQLIGQNTDVPGEYLDPYTQQLMMNMFVTPELPMDIGDQRDYRNAYQDTITTGADRMAAYVSNSFAPGAFEDVMPDPVPLETPGLSAALLQSQGNPDTFQAQVSQWALPTEYGGLGLNEGEIMMRIDSIVNGEADISPEAQTMFIGSMPTVQESSTTRRRNRRVGGEAEAPLVDMDAVRTDVKGIIEPIATDRVATQAPGATFDPQSQSWYTQGPAEQSEASEWLDRVNLPNPYLEYGTDEYYRETDPEQYARGQASTAAFQNERQGMIDKGQDIAAGARERGDFDQQMQQAMAQYKMALGEWGDQGQQTPHQVGSGSPVQPGMKTEQILPGTEEWLERKMNPLAQYEGGGFGKEVGGVDLQFTPQDWTPQSLQDRGAMPQQSDYTEPVHNNFGPTSTVSMWDRDERIQKGIQNRQAMQRQAMSQVGTQNDLLNRVMAEQQLARQGRTPGMDTVMARLAPLYQTGALGR